MLNKRWILDVVLLLLTVLLMPYKYVGKAGHELLALALCAFLLLHFLWNRGWFKGFSKGEQNIVRLFDSSVNILLILSLIVSMVTGLMISRWLLPHFFPITRETAVQAHMLHKAVSYFFFLLSAVHLGWHGSAVWAKLKQKLRLEKLFLRPGVDILAAAGTAALGIDAFMADSFISKLTLVRRPPVRYTDLYSALQDFVFVLLMCAVVGYYLRLFLAKRK